MQQDWRTLRSYAMYRLVLSVILLMLVWWDVTPPTAIASQTPEFRIIVYTYLGFSMLSTVAVFGEWTSRKLLTWAQVFADIVLLSLLMDAGGGLSSGLGVLIVVAVAAGSILVSGRGSLLFAALATLLVLVEQLVPLAGSAPTTPNFTHAGLLGVAFFAAASLVSVLARRVRVTEAMVARREGDIASLAALNEHIVQRMQSGVAVLDARGRLRMMNRSAQKLLGVAQWQTGLQLAGLSPDLEALYQRWIGDYEHTSYYLKPENQALTMVASFAGIGANGEEGTVIFLEDAAATTQRAQQLKLASLGRLAGSIAHEIRNPLGAISHAGQLLEESTNLDLADRRLTRIIRENSARVNAMVENVLQLGRTRPAAPRSFDLLPWLNDFLAEFHARRPGTEEIVHCQVAPSDLRVRVDQSQLHQVLWNLCDNALQHAGDPPRVSIGAGLGEHTRRPYLDVADNGEGIAEADLPRVFEPFFTTRDEGTGLGLYIARELCEGNQASLTLEPSNRGCRFRVTFADPRRRGVAAQ